MVNTYNHVADKSVLNQRHPNDLYVTPPALIRHFFESAFFTLEMVRPRRDLFSVLDLGAGDARWGEGVRRYLHEQKLRNWKWSDKQNRIHITGVDLEMPDVHYADTYHIMDYFSIGCNGTHILSDTYDMVVANPPFRDSLAKHGAPRPDDGLTFRDGVERTLRIGMQFVREGGAVVLFHPFNTLWGQGRYERLFSKWTYFLPFRTYIIPFRVPLVEGVTTGLPTEFAISVWQKSNWDHLDEYDRSEQPSLTVEFLPPMNAKQMWKWEDEETQKI